MFCWLLDRFAKQVASAASSMRVEGPCAQKRSQHVRVELWCHEALVLGWPWSASTGHERLARLLGEVGCAIGDRADAPVFPVVGPIQHDKHMCSKAFGGIRGRSAGSVGGAYAPLYPRFDGFGEVGARGLERRRSVTWALSHAFAKYVHVSWRHGGPPVTYAIPHDQARIPGAPTPAFRHIIGFVPTFCVNT